MRRLLVSTGLLVCLVLFAARPVAAARPLAEESVPLLTTIAGLVLDDTGGVVPGAAVRLRVPGRPVEEAFSDAEGRFAFERVPYGPVAISVSLTGFATTTLDLDRPRAAVRVVLRPGAVSEQLTVRPDAGPAPAVNLATRTSTPLRDVPQAVTIVGHETIADQAMQNMADVVRYVPGVGMAQGEGNRDNPIFRGNTSTSDFFVDGVRDDVQYFRDLYNVERVEALKGPNAMMFGRGGAGGVINRVTRQANFSPVREVALQAGSFDSRRATFDLGQVVSRGIALRLTGVYENSGSYRDRVGLERYGVNPTAALMLGSRTVLTTGYEHFHDERTADRGVPSFRGRPLPADPSTFFGDPDTSRAGVTVDAATAAIEHRVAGGLVLRSCTRFANYDKFYQNVFPGAVDATVGAVALSAYNNATRRQNTFNQTDLSWTMTTGGIRHTVLVGGELTRQVTSNFRNTGYFVSAGRAVATVNVPIAAPTVSLPVSFRQSATDADNSGVATGAAVYAQDEMRLSTRVQAIVGLRYDDFQVRFHNNRANSDLRTVDHHLAPRAGLVFKPATPVSIYASYSLAFVPRAGEQLSSLTLSNRALDPERFRNYEVGSKWDVGPGVSLAAAVYRLDRTNIAVADPANPANLVLVAGQRTRGVELGVTGHPTAAWSVMAGYAFQRGEITRSLSATAPAGARLAQVPPHSFSMWNRYDFTPAVGAGVGLVRRDRVFTTTDNTVVLPAFTRVDAAMFLSLSRRLRAQANVENVLARLYYASANGNNNITPGSPRAVRLSLTTMF